MTTHGPSNPHLPNGQPLDPALEADLLAWIEGEPLPAARDAAVARYLNAHPKYAERLLRMKGDREALRALADEPAPAGLVQGALEALEPVLERQMLLDLAQGEPVGGGPPVSIVRPPRQSLWETFTADRLGRRLAMAAALLLLVGGVTYFAADQLGDGAGRPSFEDESGPIALQQPPEDEAPSILFDASPAREVAAAPEWAMMKSEPASDAGRVEEPAPTTLAATGRGASAGAADLAEAKPAEVLVAAPEAPEPVEIGPERALELAREGRLAIRVLSGNPERAVTRLENRASRRSAAAPWRLGGEVDETIIAALANPGPSTALVRADLPPEDLRPTFAGMDLPPEVRMLLPGSETTSLAFELPVPAHAVPHGRMVEVRLDERTLESVRKEAARVAGGRAVYEELPTALPPETPPVSPASVFWWTQPPSAWGGWGRVPVIIEAR